MLSRSHAPLSPLCLAPLCLAITAAVSPAQVVTSAHSGTLHYFDGDVAIDGTPVVAKVSRFPEIKEKSVLSTRQGRAEVLLTPGVFLRIGENSSVKMLDTRLVSTRVEILTGNAVLESDDPEMSVKDSPVTLLYKDYEIRPVKHGLFEIAADDGQMKVYKGDAVVTSATGDLGERVTVKEGRQVRFSAALPVEAFNDKVGDDLYLWTRDRSQSISAANMSSARTLNNGSGLGGYGFGGSDPYALSYGLGGYGGYGGYGAYGPLSAGPWAGGWYFNPFFDMYTFVPVSGVAWNAFGYGFFSPGMINAFYSPTNYWYGGGGARGTGSFGQPLDGIASRSSLKPAPISNLQPRGNSGGVFSTGYRGVGEPALGSAAISRGGFSGEGLSGVGSRSGGFSEGGGSGHASIGGGGHAGGGGHR